MPETNAPSTAPEESQVATQDEEVAERAKELDDLRREIQERRDERLRREQDLSHELRLTELETEKARLVAELAAEERLDARLDATAVSSFQNAEEVMRAAVARQKASEDLEKTEREAAAKAKSDATPNPLLDDQPVVDGGQPSVAARSVPPVATPAKGNGSTGKAAK